MFHVPRPTIVIVSDAQADPGSQPSAGAIAILPDGSSRALFAELPEELLTLWGFPREARQTGKNPIAVCEAAVVLLSLWQWRHLLANCDVLWYIDNSVSLHSIVKGMGKEQSISRVAEAIGIISYRLNIHLWYEFVASKDNLP